MIKRIILLNAILLISIMLLEGCTKKAGDKVGEEVTTPSGLKYVDEKIGDGAAPTQGQILTVHYDGMLQDGKTFDSSRDRCKPIQFKLGVAQVIKGWDEGFSTMKVGGKRKLIIPPQLGYGDKGIPGVIPENATLTFDVELLDAK